MGVYGVDLWCHIPFSDTYFVKDPEVYSPLLWESEILTFLLDYSFTSVHHRMNVLSFSSFVLSGYAQNRRIVSSTNMMKYWASNHRGPYVSALGVRVQSRNESSVYYGSALCIGSIRRSQTPCVEDRGCSRVPSVSVVPCVTCGLGVHAIAMSSTSLPRSVIPLVQSP